MRCDEYMGEFVTREALFCIQVSIQRCGNVNNYVYVCFVDYQKAFYIVKHDKLIELLIKIGKDKNYLRIINNQSQIFHIRYIYCLPYMLRKHSN